MLIIIQFPFKIIIGAISRENDKKYEGPKGRLSNWRKQFQQALDLPIILGNGSNTLINTVWLYFPATFSVHNYK